MIQLPYMNELNSSLHCTVRTLCVTSHIDFRYSPLSFGLFYLVSVLFMKAPSLVNGPWVMEKTMSMIERKSNDAITVYE